ncbi:uncharacterized protein BCR38DRAFT_436677 [Pseudomassariella vexata]|uniref:GIY-YIG domain-containing protein n=1 Tax=Pseudomassariella vexata TaxID=1141098 RepID=A0A1Y2DW54_9PEZI|nr:uncharacterized protein BCR38DRAFT_436677 [Pseudomassariella vexata]ORY63366.1 hypothetical protein BCR38DRAFT_436677 [Pseudomassariella vexata]
MSLRIMTNITVESANTLLTHLLAELSYPASPQHFQRYGSWVDSEGVRDALTASLRPEVFELFGGAELPKWNEIRDATTHPLPETRGIYLDLIRGLDGRDRLYVGQSKNVAFRISKCHMSFRHRRDNKSLHYFAIDRSKWNNFVVLAVLPPLADPALESRADLVMNVLEMWCALLFRTLQGETLGEWLPAGWVGHGTKGENGMGMVCNWYPLNLKLPLDQGVATFEGGDWMTRLNASEDPLAREYAEGKRELVDKGEKTSVEASLPTPPSVDVPSLLLGAMIGAVAVMFITKRR